MCQPSQRLTAEVTAAKASVTRARRGHCSLIRPTNYLGGSLLIRSECNTGQRRRCGAGVAHCPITLFVNFSTSCWRLSCRTGRSQRVLSHPGLVGPSLPTRTRNSPNSRSHRDFCPTGPVRMSLNCERKPEFLQRCHTCARAHMHKQVKSAIDITELSNTMVCNCSPCDIGNFRSSNQHGDQICSLKGRKKKSNKNKNKNKKTVADKYFSRHATLPND